MQLGIHVRARELPRPGRRAGRAKRSAAPCFLRCRRRKSRSHSSSPRFCGRQQIDPLLDAFDLLPQRLSAADRRAASSRLRARFCVLRSGRWGCGIGPPSPQCLAPASGQHPLPVVVEVAVECAAAPSATSQSSSAVARSRWRSWATTISAPCNPAAPRSALRACRCPR